MHRLAKPWLMWAKQTWVVFCSAGFTETRTYRTLETNPQNHLFITSYTLGLISVSYIEECINNSWTKRTVSVPSIFFANTLQVAKKFLLLPCVILCRKMGQLWKKQVLCHFSMLYKRQDRCFSSKKPYTLPPPKATNSLKLEKAIKFFLCVESSLHEWIESGKYWDMLKSADLVWYS